MTPALSIWLDLCRVLAALCVFVGHSVALQVAPPFLSLGWHRSADDAVIAFFVISGWVIAHTSKRQQADPSAYAFARLSRVYSVALPAVLFALALDLIGMRINPAPYTPDWQYPTLWFYLPFHWLFLGETWFGAIQPFSMAPYWSLGYEVWYYLLFGLLMYWRGRWRWPVIALVLCLMGPRILMLLPVWWLGVWLCDHHDRLRLAPGPARLLMLAAAAAYAAFLASGARAGLDRLSRSFYGWLDARLPAGFDAGSTVHVFPDYVVAMLFAAFLVGCAYSAWTFGDRTARLIRALAGFTFTFYLIHFTLLVFAQAIGVHIPGLAGYLLLLAAVLAFTWLLAQVGEHRRHWYRGVLIAAWQRLRRAGVGPVSRRGP